MTTNSFHVFALHFAKHIKALYGKNQKVLLFCDGAAAHQLPSDKDVNNVVLEQLPTASPELNPVERFFEELRKELANQIFETIEVVENKIADILNQYYNNLQKVISLCNYPYLSNT